MSCYLGRLYACPRSMTYNWYQTLDEKNPDPKVWAEYLITSDFVLDHFFELDILDPAMTRVTISWQLNFKN